MSSNTWLPTLFSNSEQWLTRYASGNWSGCSPSSFASVDLPNIQLLALTAEPRVNYTYVPSVIAPPYNNITAGLDFCNVTVTYTHPGWNDTIVTTIFLPTKNWNGRYQAHGGAGYVSGGSGLLFLGMMPALAEGYAGSTTDGGHISNLASLSGPTMPWALSSPGNVNWPLLLDYASVSQHEMAQLSKLAIQDFYEELPKYSYFFGASQGGRQGNMYAQRFPEDFDGITALFPAVNWNQRAALVAWPGFVMDQAGVHPPACEMYAITKAAIKACDLLDGVEDGLISRPDLCTFDAHSVVGQAFDCEGTPSTISKGAAIVTQATWEGPRSSTGKFQWYGYLRGANISAPGAPAGTTCTVSNSTGIRTCVPAPYYLGEVWLRYWVLKYADASIRNITHEQWDELVDAASQEYDSVIGTADPDLSRFKRAGGKMITWHGLTDNLITPNGTVDYYNRVTALDPEVHDYFRFFLAPGIAHEFGGTLRVTDSYPASNRYIVDWVEKGIAPEVLRQTGVDPKGNVLERDLCPYPKVQHYIGGDLTKAEAFKCV